MEELNALLTESEEYDPSAPNIDSRWARLRRPDGDAKATPTTPEAEPSSVQQTAPRKPSVPRVGTVVQRSDAANRRKQAILLSDPPPPPPHQRTAATRKAATGKPAAAPSRSGPPTSASGPTRAARPSAKLTVSAGALAPKLQTTSAPGSTRVSRPSSGPDRATYSAPAPVIEPLPTPPPPPPVPNAEAEPLRIVGTQPSPPIKIELEPGLIAEVPHFAVHVTRKYKIRIPEGRFVVRFNRNGTLRMVRRQAG